MPSNKTIFLTIMLMFTLGQIGIDLYLPSLLSIASSLNTDTDMVQLTITSYISSMIFSQPIYGIASDAYGRRRILIIGMSLATLGSFICMQASNINILLTGRFIQGLGAGAGTTVCRAMLRDLYSGHEFVKNASYLAVFGMIFMVTAPIIGGYIEYYLNWRANFILLFILCFIIVTSLITIMPETNNHTSTHHIKLNAILENFRTLLKSDKFITYTLCSTLTYANVFSWITAAPILLQENYNLSPINFGWCYFFAGISYAIGNICNRKLIYRIEPNNLIILGFILQITVGLLILILYLNNLDNVYTILTSMSILMFGISIVFPNSNAGALNDHSGMAGTASALFSIIQTSGAALASAYVASINSHDLILIASCLIVLSFIGVTLCTMSRNKFTIYSNQAS